MNLKRPVLLAAVVLMAFAAFLIGSCALPATDATTDDAARLTGSQALSSFTHQLTMVGSDVICPKVKWYFTKEAVAESGYHYRFTMSYFHHSFYDQTDPGSWTTIGTINKYRFSAATQTVQFTYSWAAALVKGRVQLWKVKDSTGVATYVGAYTEPNEYLVMVSSD
jgi:hypothetical protein